MRKRAARLRARIRHHPAGASAILIVLLIGMGCGLSWTINLICFGLPPPRGQDCGSIIHSEAPPERTTRADATIRILTCFWHAYQSCQAATVSQTEAATDAGATDTFTLAQQFDHCAIYGQEEAQANTETRNSIENS